MTALTGVNGTNTYPFGSVVITLTAILGGADTSVLFDKAGVIGEDAGFTFDYTNKALTLTSIANPAASTLTLTGGTALTTSQPVLSMTQTWNNAAVTFTGFSFSVTNTASATGSLLMNLLAGAAGTTSMFNVDKSGNVTIPTSSRFWTVANLCGISSTVGGNLILTVNGGPALTMFQASASIFEARWAGNAVTLANDAAGFLVQRNGTNAQKFGVYNTFTDASNYERGGFDWQTTANTLRIRSENLGTGTNRLLALDGFIKAGAAVAADLPTSGWGLIHDSSGATTKLCYNDAGTLRTVALV